MDSGGDRRIHNHYSWHQLHTVCRRSSLQLRMNLDSLPCRSNVHPLMKTALKWKSCVEASFSVQGMPHGVPSNNDQVLGETKRSDKNFDDKRSRCGGGEGNRSWDREMSSSTDSHMAATADMAEDISPSENPFPELELLRQQGAADEYVEEFELLNAQISPGLNHYMGLLLGRLKEEVQAEVMELEPANSYKCSLLHG